MKLKPGNPDNPTLGVKAGSGVSLRWETNLKVLESWINNHTFINNMGITAKSNRENESQVQEAIHSNSKLKQGTQQAHVQESQTPVREAMNLHLLGVQPAQIEKNQFQVFSINHHTFIINVGSAASSSWEQISSSEHNSLKFRIKVGLARHLKVRSHIMRVDARSNVVFLAMLDITICLGVQNVLVHASGCHQPADLLEIMPWTCKFGGRLPQNLDIWNSIFSFRAHSADLETSPFGQDSSPFGQSSSPFGRFCWLNGL